jgi:hypothetical protein
MPPPIPVVCDRCRTEGLAGEDPFLAFGALLDFDPVPRRTTRADGWDSETQRAYIAALSLTGSDRAACRAVGKAQFGLDRLLAHDGGASFAAAREEALAIAADERGRRLAEGVRAVAAEQSGWRPAAAPWSRAAGRDGGPVAPAPAAAPSEEELEAADERTMKALESVVRKYYLKLGEERRARLAGEIAAADLCVRQLTHIEVMMDLVSRGHGGALEVLRTFRHDGRPLLDIAETTLSLLLDDARRRHWAESGEPPRPAPPPAGLLVEQADGLRTEPLECGRGGTIEEINAEDRAVAEQHARDAEAQVEWEAQARRDYEERRDSDASS